MTILRRIGPSIRLALARRPWIRWVVVTALAVGAGTSLREQSVSVEAERARWGDDRLVLVATRDLAPGDIGGLETRTLPIAMIPESAIGPEHDDLVVRQHVAAGEVITSVDVATGEGPAATADPDDVVVPVSDPLLADATATMTIGLDVRLHSDGLLIADHATITAIDGDVVFVAVDPADAAVVAAAAQQRVASIAFLP